MIKDFLKRIALITALPVFMFSCGGGESNTTSTADTQLYPWNAPYKYLPQNCSSVDEKKLFVYRVLTDTYYWYKEVPTEVDLSKYKTPEEVLENLKYQTLDRWSYITDKTTYDSYFEEGSYIGLGLKLKYDPVGNVRISFVYPNSPADRAGLKRGDIVLAINGKTIEEIEKENLWSSIWGENKVGVPVSLKIKKLNTNETLSLTLEKDKFIIETVPVIRILDIEGKKVGYLLFLTFIEPAEDRLMEVFQYFKEQGVEELILDLRYNRGGRTYIAKLLASLISGLPSNYVYVRYKHNDKYSYANWSSFFLNTHGISLNLNRLIVLTTSSTCSASETVINGLRAYIDVVTIGSNTCGKPTGMYPVNFCDKVLSAINFETVNANGEGGYYGGFKPLCGAIDNLTVELGNPNEDILKEALHYVKTGTCTSSSNYRYQVENIKKIKLKGFKNFIEIF